MAKKGLVLNSAFQIYSLAIFEELNIRWGLASPYLALRPWTTVTTLERRSSAGPSVPTLGKQNLNDMNLEYRSQGV